MTTRKHQVDEVLRSLRTKKDVRIIGNEIQVLKNQVFSEKLDKLIDNPQKQNDLGNGTWGKIDFLVNHNGFRLIRVPQF